jgi:hypothetical protein
MFLLALQSQVSDDDFLTKDKHSALDMQAGMSVQ